MNPKGFPHHLHHFFRRNSTNFIPIWAHFVSCMVEFSCILAIPCSENSVFLEKTVDPKRHPKTSKRLPTSSKCRNALFLIIFSRRFTHVSLGSSHTHAYFGWASTWICMGPDLEIIWEVKKSKKFRFFIIAQIGSKRLPTSSTSLFSPNIHQFYPHWSPVWGMHSEF